MMKKLLALLLSFQIIFINSIASAAGVTTFFHGDHIGSPTYASDDFGEVKWQERYKPYGERVDHEPAALDNDLWYTGKAHDEDTALTYMNARYYDPVLGRFMAVDPVGIKPTEAFTFNRYAYANNNPYKYIDPDGEFAFAFFAVIGFVSLVGFSDDANTPVSQNDIHSKGAGEALLTVMGVPMLRGLTSLSIGALKGVPKGLRGNKDFKAALGQFKNTKFTNAGRAVTKHPEYFGFKNTEALRKVYNTEAKINRLAADTLKDIMRTGKTTTGAGGRYPSGWKTVTAPDGRAASWHADGRFIGFRGVQ